MKLEIHAKLSPKSPMEDLGVEGRIITNEYLRNKIEVVA
jgi:hypothetical protein